MVKYAVSWRYNNKTNRSLKTFKTKPEAEKIIKGIKKHTKLKFGKQTELTKTYKVVKITK